MEFFDPFVALDATSDIDLRNLAYFGTRSVLMASGSPRRCDDAGEVVGTFEALARRRDEVESHHIHVRLALGVQARSAPLRAIPALWDRFPTLVETLGASAIGILSIESGEEREYRLLERQLAVAAALGLPALVQLPARRARAVVPQVRAAVGHAGVSPSRVLVLVRSSDLTPGFLGLLGGLGAAAELRPAHLATEPHRGALLDALVERGDCLTHGLVDGLGDVMTMARVALELGGFGVPRNTIHDLVFANAQGRFPDGGVPERR